MTLEAALAANTAALEKLCGLLSAPPLKAPAVKEAGITYSDVADALVQLAKSDRQRAVGLLARYGAKNLSEVPKDKWAEIKREAQA